MARIAWPKAIRRIESMRMTEGQLRSLDNFIIWYATAWDLVRWRGAEITGLVPMGDDADAVVDYIERAGLQAYIDEGYDLLSENEMPPPPAVWPDDGHDPERIRKR